MNSLIRAPKSCSQTTWVWTPTTTIHFLPTSFSFNYIRGEQLLWLKFNFPPNEETLGNLHFSQNSVKLKSGEKVLCWKMKYFNLPERLPSACWRVPLSLFSTISSRNLLVNLHVHEKRGFEKTTKCCAIPETVQELNFARLTVVCQKLVKNNQASRFN